MGLPEGLHGAPLPDIESADESGLQAAIAASLSGELDTTAEGFDLDSFATILDPTARLRKLFDFFSTYSSPTDVQV